MYYKKNVSFFAKTCKFKLLARKYKYVVFSKYVLWINFSKMDVTMIFQGQKIFFGGEFARFGILFRDVTNFRNCSQNVHNATMFWLQKKKIETSLLHLISEKKNWGRHYVSHKKR